MEDGCHFLSFFLQTVSLRDDSSCASSDCGDRERRFLVWFMVRTAAREGISDRLSFQLKRVEHVLQPLMHGPSEKQHPSDVQFYSPKNSKRSTTTGLRCWLSPHAPVLTHCTKRDGSVEAAAHNTASGSEPAVSNNLRNQLFVSQLRLIHSSCCFQKTWRYLSNISVSRIVWTCL